MPNVVMVEEYTDENGTQNAKYTFVEVYYDTFEAPVLDNHYVAVVRKHYNGGSFFLFNCALPTDYPSYLYD